MDRKITGDLTGLYRLRFDAPDHRPERFRLVYRHTQNGTIVEMLTAGARDEHRVYREALTRLAQEPSQ